MSRRKKEKTEASFRELLGLDSRRSRPAPDKPTSPLCSETSWKTLTTAARRISVRFLPLRILRRSFATHLCENGADQDHCSNTSPTRLPEFCPDLRFKPFEGV